MAWMETLALFAFFCWLTRRAHESAAECAPTVVLRSPLYWTAMILVCVLFGLAFSERCVLNQGSTILFWVWLTSFVASVIALLVVRRALKWRYPI